MSPLFTLPKGYSIKTFDAETVQEIFEKSLSNSEVAQGLAYAFGKVKGKMISEADGEAVRQTITKGSKIAIATLGRAI